ncbi:MAG: 1-acyl-sn-glycerol-3-phosphate acyltransferase [Candidatus Thermoplasmatota archaeon]
MASTPAVWQWLGVVALAILLYELLRVQVVAWLKRRQEARVDRFLREHRIPSDPFRHTHRVVVKEMVLADPGLVEAMAERARADGTDMGAVQTKVRGWLDEIVPQFNLFAYYGVGRRIARIAAYSTYNVRLDRASHDRAMAQVPPNAAVVLVSNHRSNADFVVTGFMLSKSVQVSYAVGEWARVWPLEGLFKSFGSYFVRRGEKDPLYHRTLRSYVELITKQGVTQAMFPEGGLSRDGKLRPAKLGLLDSMVLAKADPAFVRPLVFVPVGINFDRVLEDEVLVRETLAGDHPLRNRTPTQKAKRLATLLGKGLVAIPLNLGRFFAKRLKKHGICAIHFGDPLTLDDWLEANPKALATQDRRERHKRLRPLGDELMRRIAAAVPVTPVPLVCAAMADLGADRLTTGVGRGDLLLAMRARLDALQLAGAPFFTGDPYAHRAEERARLDAQAHARHDLDAVHLGLSETDDLDETLDRALDVMARRGLLFADHEGILRTHPIRWDLVRYYANSLAGPAVAESGKSIAHPVAA